MKIIKTIVLLITGAAGVAQAADTITCPDTVTCEQSKTAIWDKGFKETCTEVVSVTKISNERLEIECSVDNAKGWRYALIVNADGYDIEQLNKPGDKPEKTE